MKIQEELNFYTALFGAKTINHGLHIFKSPGTSLPGVVAMKISKNFLSYISKYCQKGIITVTGTNGKTTTSGLFAHILKTAGNSVLHNDKGANMLSGMATSLAVNYKPFSKFDYAVLEADEAYLTKLYDYINADYLFVTNLFHDQLDRYGELDTTEKKIQEAITKNPNLKIFVNADDPTLSELGKNNEKILFGFEKIVFQNSQKDTKTSEETILCTCKENLSYEEKYYAHVGKYFCNNCGKKRQKPNYKGFATIYDDYNEITVVFESNGIEKELKFKSNLIGLYNAYNALAAISAGLELGLEQEIIQAGLDTYKSAFGRADKFTIKGKNVLVQLIKNPTGASEVLRTINEKTCKKLLIAINDNYADGRDISWLWDTDFEKLTNYPISITVSGIRAYDMATRLKYAGFDESKITINQNLKEAVQNSLDEISEGEQLLIMPTYTALLEMQKFLKA